MTKRKSKPYANKDFAQIAVYMPTWMVDRINRVANFWGESVSSTMRMLLREAFKHAPDPRVQELPLEGETSKSKEVTPLEKPPLELM